MAHFCSNPCPTPHCETIQNRVLTRKSFSTSPFVLFPVWQNAHSRTSLTTHHFGQHPVLNGLVLCSKHNRYLVGLTPIKAQCYVSYSEAQDSTGPDRPGKNTSVFPGRFLLKALAEIHSIRDVIQGSIINLPDGAPGEVVLIHRCRARNPALHSVGNQVDLGAFWRLGEIGSRRESGFSGDGAKGV